MRQEAVMKKMPQIRCLFLDIGGVLLTDGWDTDARGRAAAKFDLDLSEMEERHHIVFATYEEGKFTLDEYLNRTVFYAKRPFTRDMFKEFMFGQSRAFPEMIELVQKLKAKYGLKTIVVSNEARELNAYRIRQFKLDEFVDAFVSSFFVHMRKPDPDIFGLALDMAQVPRDQIVYIENTSMFVDIARNLGIRSILHTDYETTRTGLAKFGLETDKGEAHATS